MGGDVVTIGDVSKSLGLGGLRIGWLSSADAELVDRVRTLRDLTTLESGAPSQVLATIALRNRCHFAATTIARNNLDALARWVLSVGAQLSPQPCDGLVAFPLLGSAAQQLVDRARSVGVSVMPGDLFGHGGRLRIGLGVDPEVFADALERLGDLIATP